MEYKIERLTLNNTQMATEHLNRLAKEGWRALHFFETSGNNLGVVMAKDAKDATPVMIHTLPEQPEPSEVKRGRGRPKKVTTEA